MTLTDIALLCAGVIALVGGLMAVTSRLMTHAVIMAAVAHVGVAACLMLLGGELVGTAQLLLGVLGGVVLLLVALTVTRAPLDRHDDLDVSWARRAGAGATGLAAAGLLAVALLRSVGWHAVGVADRGPDAVAAGLFSTWWWALLLTAVLLVTSVLGTVFLARRGEGS